MSDPPDPNDRDEFLQWMVGKQFRYDRPTESIHFEGIEAIKEQEGVKTESEVDITEQVNVDAVYLQVETLETTEETVEGAESETTITTVDPADDTGETHKIPFDTVRISWLQGRIEQL